MFNIQIYINVLRVPLIETNMNINNFSLHNR